MNGQDRENLRAEFLKLGKLPRCMALILPDQENRDWLQENLEKLDCHTPKILLFSKDELSIKWDFDPVGYELEVDFQTKQGRLFYIPYDREEGRKLEYDAIPLDDENGWLLIDSLLSKQPYLKRELSEPADPNYRGSHHKNAMMNVLMILEEMGAMDEEWTLKSIGTREICCNVELIANFATREIVAELRDSGVYLENGKLFITDSNLVWD